MIIGHGSLTAMPEPRYRILIVDDEPNMLHMLSAILTQDGFETRTAETGQQAIQMTGEEEFDFILSDVRMAGMDGIQLLEQLRSRGVEALVILMSAYGTVDLALEALQKGAYDYISKPFKPDEVVLTLRKAAERERLRREVVRLKRLLGHEQSREIVAKSPALVQILETVHQVAQFESSVLITGESGTGKEVIAREIHKYSQRSEGPFVAVNCGAIPTELLESELFGHGRGAFTGATSAKAGLFEEASSGTLFLDEIGTTVPSFQMKLLRVLDSGELRRLGETRTRRVSVRVVAATNENLEALVQNGQFREDLYYRLNVVRIHIPPLRERREDIMPLVEHFVERFNRKFLLNVSSVSKEAQEALLSAPWRGNVRELQNVIERAMILCEKDVITLDCLPHDIRACCRGGLPSLESTKAETLSLKKATRDLERNLILKALNRTGGNRSQAAALLEISYPSLLQKIKDYGLS